mmetsp:Transcript_43603/g.50162  ORF Transcript_43603/g.50162 Transcript_43603/m.50162 type:complete len:446 (+) Transcript_43603:59-1396(+)
MASKSNLQLFSLCLVISAIIPFASAIQIATFDTWSQTELDQLVSEYFLSYSPSTGGLIYSQSKLYDGDAMFTLATWTQHNGFHYTNSFKVNPSGYTGCFRPSSGVLTGSGLSENSYITFSCNNTASKNVDYFVVMMNNSGAIVKNVVFASPGVNPIGYNAAANAFEVKFLDTTMAIVMQSNYDTFVIVLNSQLELVYQVTPNTSAGMAFSALAAADNSDDFVVAGGIRVDNQDHPYIATFNSSGQVLQQASVDLPDIVTGLAVSEGVIQVCLGNAAGVRTLFLKSSDLSVIALRTASYTSTIVRCSASNGVFATNVPNSQGSLSTWIFDVNGQEKYAFQNQLSIANDGVEVTSFLVTNQGDTILYGVSASTDSIAGIPGVIAVNLNERGSGFHPPSQKFNQSQSPTIVQRSFGWYTSSQANEFSIREANGSIFEPVRADVNHLIG